MNDHLQDTDWAYLAGFVDGEGCISSYKSSGRYYPRLSIVQADHVVLLGLYRRFDVGRVNIRRRTAKNKATGDQLSWNIRTKAQLKWLLEGLLPYLKLKKSQAEIALQLLGNSQDQAKVLQLAEHKKVRRTFTGSR